MLITFGTRYYGHMEKTRSGLSVATLFFHIMWIPFVPISSAVMRDDAPLVGLPLSLGSVLMTYVRTICLFAPLIVWGMTTADHSSDQLALYLAIPCALVFVLSYLLVFAAPHRAEAIEALARER